MQFGSMSAGGLGATALLYAKYNDPSANPPMDTEGVRDRAYRLHFHQGQRAIDRYSQFGAVGSSIAAFCYYFGSVSAPTLAINSLLFSASGVAAGCALHGTVLAAHYFTLNPPSELRKKLLKSLTDRLP